MFTSERSFQRSLAVASRPLTLSCQRRLYLHPAINRGSIFLPPCHSPYEVWFIRLLVALLSLKEIVVEGLPCSIEFRAFPAKHPLFAALRIYVFGRSLFFSSDTDIFLFHHMPSLRFFRFRTSQFAFSGYCLGVRL